MDNFKQDKDSSEKVVQPRNKIDSYLEQLTLDKEKYLSLLHMDDMGAVKKYVSAYQKLLHDYNDIKDAAVLLLGKIANLEHLSIAEVYIRYNVTFDNEK